MQSEINTKARTTDATDLDMGTVKSDTMFTGADEPEE
jgi:hypothetical protein